MKIGDKIAKLRIEKGISQEQLAEIMSVSRQSVSKWEINQALPQIDKVIQLCELFAVSTDELLREDICIKSKEKQELPNKYFGTDGFRGEANVGPTATQAYKVGRFLGWYYSSKIKAGQRPKIVIGKDTRRSSYMLEYAIAAGITASGADAYMLHVTTTPSVSYVTRLEEFDCGIMITASHNPYYDNGIKIINRYGEKLDDETASYIEAYIDGELKLLGVEDDLPYAKREQIGCIVDHSAGRNRYVGYLISLASHSYKHLRIGLDCANGASWMIAKSVFGALGASVVTVGTQPNGLNVNQNCGSTHIENLCRIVKEKHLDVGFAFDGDADRCIAVDENGNIVDGDKMMYILGKRLKQRGILNDDTIVLTIMSNSGLIKSLENIGIKCIKTNVGDRFVYEAMQNNDYCLGGEQSGHIILKKYATTGDGILTAIMIAEQMCDAKSSLSVLAKDVVLYPQYTKNIYVKNKDKAVEDKEVLNAVKSVEDMISGNGRVLLRKSGTEPVVRVMIECEDERKCEEYADLISDMIEKRGHSID